jgi:hypothetical protein
MNVSVNKIIRYLKIKGYLVFDKPYQLNIIGVRSPETASNTFDDELHVFYRDSFSKWIHRIFPITTDPGTYFLKNPMQVDGTAILKEGQYVNVYQLGLHRKEYKALVQTGGKVTVIRDYDRNAVLDFFNGHETTGWYGINIHRARPHGETKIVDRWSAGCQVFKNANDFDTFIGLCESQRMYYGNKFTYTLIDLRALKRAARRWFVYGAAATLIMD